MRLPISTALNSRADGDAAPSLSDRLAALSSSSGPRRARKPRRARSGSSNASRAFSLIELLVVVGVIVLLVGGGALALAGRGGEGAALSSAQNVLAGLVSGARAQAALHQTTTRLIIYAQMPPAANADATKYLRSLQIVRQETLPNGSTGWVASGDPVALPAPICVVPTAPVPTNHLRSGVIWNNNVAMGPVSTLSTQTGFNYRGQNAATATQFFGRTGQSGRIHFLEFAPDGTMTSPVANPTKIALTTAVLSSSALPQFSNASAVRGLFIRRSGAISLVHTATGF